MKRGIIVFLSVFLFISAPFHANANIVTATGKYIINAVKHAPGGAKVHATNSATGAKHVIKHGVSSADLGKSVGASIAGGLISGGLVLAFQAITGLALDAVDWVMDPENNAIKWKVEDNPDVINPSYQYVWRDVNNVLHANYTLAGQANCDKYSRGSLEGWQGGNPSSSSTSLIPYCELGNHNAGAIHRVSNPSYDPTAPSDGYKSLPLVDLAKKVIEQADGGQVDSQKTIEDYVTNLAKEGELDNELDNATDITKPDEPTKPEDPDKDCPIGTTKEGEVCVKPAPDNAPLFCNQSDFTRKVCDWIDWTQVKHDEPLPDAGKVDVIDKSKNLNIDKNRIDFTNQCPAPTPINTSVGGFPVSTELNYQPLCDFFTMLNPFVIGMGGISSALIIAGGARRG